MDFTKKSLTQLLDTRLAATEQAFNAKDLERETQQAERERIAAEAEAKKDPKKVAMGKATGHLGAEYGSLGGSPTKRFRKRAGTALDQKFDVLLLIIDLFIAGDQRVRAIDVIKAVEAMHKMSGRDVIKISETDSEGNDTETVDLDALKAFRESLRSADLN